MVSEKETAGIRRFIIRQLHDEPDLSTLTIGILKKRYMTHMKCDSLSPEAKKIMKKVVEEELVKMQENDKSESESEIPTPPNKKKREREQEEGEEEKRPSAKKSRAYLSSSASDSEEDGDSKPKRSNKRKPQPDDAKQEMKKSTSGKNGNVKQQNTSDDSSGEEVNESEEGATKSESPEKTVTKNVNASKNGEMRKFRSSVGKKTAESDQESDQESDSEKAGKSDKINDSESSDNEKEENVPAEKKNDSSSDSSSLPSLEEDNKSGTDGAREEKKKKKMKKVQSTGGQKEENKAVVRLKRYIALCGVRRNYKKLLDGCRSTRSKVAVLKKELDDLGVQGQPSIEKCKKIRLKREEAQEVAELDVDNIITTEGRSKRRGTSARQDQDPPISTYQRTLNSGSDSDQENNAGCRKMSKWTNLRGIVSDDEDSN